MAGTYTRQLGECTHHDTGTAYIHTSPFHTFSIFQTLFFKMSEIRHFAFGISCSLNVKKYEISQNVY